LTIRYFPTIQVEACSLDWQRSQKAVHLQVWQLPWTIGRHCTLNPTEREEQKDKGDIIYLLFKGMEVLSMVIEEVLKVVIFSRFSWLESVDAFILWSVPVICIPLNKKIRKVKWAAYAWIPKWRLI
jgi:hypothetical protein